MVDISDPANPDSAALYDIYDFPRAASGVAIVGDYAYVVADSGGFVIMDIADPLNASQVGSYGTATWSEGHMAISGDVAYLTAGRSGLEVLDISDPVHPSLIGTYPPTASGYAIKVLVAGDYAFLLEFDGCLLILDISNPASPSLVGSYCPADRQYSYFWGGAAAGDYVYCASWNGYLMTVEVFNRGLDFDGNRCVSTYIAPGTMVDRVRISTTQTDSVRWEVCADSAEQWQEVLPGAGWVGLDYPGDLLRWRSSHIYTGGGVNPACSQLGIEYDYLAAVEGGSDVPRFFSLSTCSPNPFGSTMAVRYALPRRERVRLAIHDVMGREIVVLRDRLQEPGWFTASWNGRNTAGYEVGSGLYFMQMTAGDFAATRKIVRLRGAGSAR